MGSCWLEGGVFVLLEAQIDTDIVFVKGRNYGLFHWGSCFACNRMVPFQGAHFLLTIVARGDKYAIADAS